MIEVNAFGKYCYRANVRMIDGNYKFFYARTFSLLAKLLRVNAFSFDLTDEQRRQLRNFDAESPLPGFVLIGGDK